MAIDLSALANFGTGYYNGQQTAEQNHVLNQMNQLSLGEQQLKYGQEQLAVKNQQALSDDAMKAFSATSGIAPPGQANGPVPPAQLPGGPQQQPAQSPTAGMDSAQKMDYLANNAAGRGDLVSANELWTNASNVRNAQVAAQQKADAIKTGELNRQIKSHALVAQMLGSATDADDFNQKRFQLTASGLVTPEEAQNLNKLQYSPQTVDAIRTSGMNSSQQASAQLRQMQEQDRQQRANLDEERKDRDQARKDLHEHVWEEHQTKQAKVGATAKAPSKADLTAANSATKLAFGDADIDEDSDEFKLARANIASRAQQIVASNKAITYQQAISQAANEAKATGEIGAKTVDGGFFGKDKKVGTFSEKGTTQDTALPLPKNKKDLIPGKWYVGPNGQKEQWTGQ